MTKRQKDKKGKRQKDKDRKDKDNTNRQRPKRGFNIVTSGQFRTLAMFLGSCASPTMNGGIFCIARQKGQ